MASPRLKVLSHFIYHSCSSPATSQTYITPQSKTHPYFPMFNSVGVIADAAQVCPPSPHGTASHAPRHTPSQSGDGGMWWWFGLRLKWGSTCSGGAAGPKVDHVERKHGPAGTFVSPCSQVARPASEQEQLAPRPRAQVKQAPLAWGPPPLPAGAALHAAAPPPPAGMDPLAPHPHLARAAPPPLPLLWQAQTSARLGHPGC